MWVDAGFGDYRTAVAVADQDTRTGLKVEDPLRRGDVVLKRRFWHLYHGHIIPILGEDLVDGLPSRAVDPGTMDEDNVFDGGCQRRSPGPAEYRHGGNHRC